jgi:hypothetical protein
MRSARESTTSFWRGNKWRSAEEAGAEGAEEEGEAGEAAGTVR